MPSFDIVSKLDLMEVDNALVQAQKEVSQRFDFKNTHTEIERADKVINMKSSAEDRLVAALDVLYTKLGKRNVSLKHVDPQKIEPSGKGVKQTINLVDGIAQDKAKQIVAAIKNSKLKVQASIQGETLRVSGKDRDELQRVIAFVRAQNFPVELQFNNFRE
jgi:cyclic-di-GMP-binding protein